MVFFSLRVGSWAEDTGGVRRRHDGSEDRERSSRRESERDREGGRREASRRAALRDQAQRAWSNLVAEVLDGDQAGYDPDVWDVPDRSRSARTGPQPLRELGMADGVPVLRGRQGPDGKTRRFTRKSGSSVGRCGTESGGSKQAAPAG